MNVNDSIEHANCYVALELSRMKWLVGALLPERDRISTISVNGSDTDGLLDALNGLRKQLTWGTRTRG